MPLLVVGLGLPESFAAQAPEDQRKSWIGMQGLGFRVWGLGFRVWAKGFDRVVFNWGGFQSRVS